MAREFTINARRAKPPERKSAAQRSLQPSGHRGQRLVQSGGIGAATLSQVWATAAFAADLAGHLLQQFAGLDASGQILVTAATSSALPASSAASITTPLPSRAFS